MKCKAKDVIFIILVAFYMIITIAHCFFNKSDFNKVISTKILFAHFYSFTVFFGCIVALISLFMLILILCKNGYKNLSVLLWSLMLVTSLLLIAFSTNTKSCDVSDKNSRIKIVEWNMENKLEDKGIYKIFREFDADVAVFPELEGYHKGEPANDRLKKVFESVGIDYDKYEVFTSIPTSGNIAAVTIVTKKSFSRYIDTKKTLMTTFGTLYLKSVDKDKPDIIGLHTAPPLLGLMSDWKRDLNIISEDIIKNNSKAIIMGDFNATLRHGALNNITTHEDVLDYSSVFKRGTWHSHMPMWISTPIDHILIPKDTYCVKKVDILNLGESDHRAIFVEISNL